MTENEIAKQIMDAALLILTKAWFRTRGQRTIGAIKKSRDVVAAWRETFGPHTTTQRRNERLKKEIMDLVTYKIRSVNPKFQSK